MSAGNTVIAHLQQSLPLLGASLQQSRAEETVVKLWLMTLENPLIELNSAQIAALWQHLPYWAFAWAGGRALAQYLINHPDQVAGKRVLDFGCGSGIVGITAAQCGASEVWVADLDNDALQAAQQNAEMNNVRLHCVSGRQWPEVDLLLAADVLYDISSSADLRQLLLRIPQCLLAESRYVAPDFVNLHKLHSGIFATLPSLGDFDEAVEVEIYCRAD